jgi:hypothetical protein
MRMTTQKTKDELLAHYATKEPKRFIQFDGFDWPGDQLADPKTGLAVLRGETWELMCGADVRVLIDPGADHVRVCQMLRNVLDDIAHTGVELKEPDWPLPENEYRCSVAGCQQHVVIEALGGSTESVRAELGLPLRDHRPGNELWPLCREHYKRMPFFAEAQEEAARIRSCRPSLEDTPF